MYNKEFHASKSKERRASKSTAFKVEYSNDYPKLSVTQAANTPRCSMENYQTRFYPESKIDHTKIEDQP